MLPLVFQQSPRVPLRAALPLLVAACGLPLLVAACGGPRPEPSSPAPAATPSAESPLPRPLDDADDGGADASDPAVDAMATALRPWEQPGPWDQGAFMPPPPPNEGDPELGRWRLLNDNIASCGVPYSLLGNPFTRALLGEPEGERLPGRSGKNADMPYFLSVFETATGAEVVNQNCLVCHGGHFNGEFVEGLGDVTRDFTTDPRAARPADLLPLARLSGATAAEIESLEYMLTFAEVLAERGRMATVGANPADSMAAALGEHLDFTTWQWSDDPVHDAVFYDHEGAPIASPAFPADPPPWWRTHKKNALLSNGMQRGAARWTMAASAAFCLKDDSEIARLDDVFADVHAYIESLRAPRYPFEIDEALAAEGKPLFERLCAGCHGTYAADPTADERDTYPNLLIPLSLVGTDPVIAEVGDVHAPGVFDTFNASSIGEFTQLQPADPFPGYMAPPLDGIWATAPFLHNGSVPTLELVLDSARRPTFWKREDFDSTNFDERALGFPYIELPYGQAEAPAEERKYIYDTTRWGYANTGHTFGDGLTPPERRALLEYLKTL